MNLGTYKKTLTIIIVLCLIMLSGCSKKMTKDEYQSFQNILNAKIEILMETSVNGAKEPFILEERKGLHISALELKEEINKIISENENKIPKEYRKDFQGNELKKYLGKLVDYIILENKDIQKERMETVDNILEITNCKFDKKPTSLNEWFEITKQEITKDLYSEFVDANDKGYQYSKEKFKKGESVIISGFANINTVAAPFYTDAFHNVLVNVSESTDANDLDRTIGWFFLINDSQHKELYEELIANNNLPIVVRIIPIDIQNPNQVLDSVGIPLKYETTKDW